MDIYKIKLWIARSSFMSIAPTVEFGSRFARTVILSRLLTQEEFGVSVAITVMLGIASLVTDVAIDKFAVIEPDKNGKEALAAVHMLSLIRGFVLALVLAASAHATAALFGVPQFGGSFAFAAVIPFVGSFAHFGIKQVQRHYNYGPETWSLLLSNLTAVCALLVAVSVFRDHRAIVVSFLIEAATYVFASHLLARTPYHLKASRELIRRALSFGIPLMFNGIGLALMAQFDRALVGHWLGVDMLAKYSVLLSVAVVPIGLVLRVFGTLSLSFILSNISKGLPASDRYGSLVFFFAVLATVYSLLIALTLDWVTPLVFGRSFDVSLTIHLALTAIVFLRLQRGGAPTNLLLALGRTRELAFLNLSAGAGLALAVVFLTLSPRFEALLWGLAAGDMLSFLLFFFASSAIVSLNKTRLIIDLSLAFGVLALILGMLAYQPSITLAARATLLGVGVVGITLQVAVGLWLQRTLPNRAREEF
jgi:O-antigen/teichoic acid export membrane protein